VPPRARVKKAAVRWLRIRQRKKLATAVAISHASNGFWRDVDIWNGLGGCFGK